MGRLDNHLPLSEVKSLTAVDETLMMWPWLIKMPQNISKGEVVQAQTQAEIIFYVQVFSANTI